MKTSSENFLNSIGEGNLETRKEEIWSSSFANSFVRYGFENSLSCLSFESGLSTLISSPLESALGGSLAYLPDAHS